MNWKKLLTAFLGTYFILFVLSYIIVTIVPIFACFVILVNAACQSGSVWNLVLSLLVYTGFLAVIVSPFVAKYFEMKKELEAKEDKNDSGESD